MEITKQNGNIAFNETEHIYWNVLTGRVHISVTQLIHKYVQPFDKEFWSTYKALERLLTKEQFSFEKKQLLNTKRINISHFYDMYELTEDVILEEKQNVLDEWETKNKKSTDRGTLIHNKIENTFYQNETCKLQKFGLGGVFSCKKDYYELDLEKGVYPEFLIYYEDDDIALSGQIDLLIKDGNEFHIYDWKTNEEIKQKSYYNNFTKKYDTMKYPLSEIMDCNFMHYTVQLSLYGWMLKQLNPNYIIKSLNIVHYGHDDSVTDYSIDFLEKEINNLIIDYKKQLVKDEQKRKRTPFEY